MKIFEPRVCTACGAPYVPTSGSAVRCVPCRKSRKRETNRKHEEKRVRDREADNAKRRASNARNRVRRSAMRRARYAKDPIGTLIQGAKDRAKELSVPFDLDQHVEHYRNAVKAGTCELTGLPFVAGTGRRSPFSPSLDRVRPELGYVHGNVRAVVWALNAGMGNWGLSDFAEVAKALLRKNPWL